MSQGDIERKTGLLRCYICRVENGHTVPAIETPEKMARAMEIPLYQIFFDSQNGEAKELKLPKGEAMKLSGKDANVISRLSKMVSRMDHRDQKILLGIAKKMSARQMCRLILIRALNVELSQRHCLHEAFLRWQKREGIQIIAVENLQDFHALG